METVRVVLPFKDQSSANYVKQQLNSLSSRLNATVQPVFVSPKLERQLTLSDMSLSPLFSTNNVSSMNSNVTCVKPIMWGYKCVYLSANRFPMTWENGIRTCTFVFRLPTPPENAIRDSSFVFPFSNTLEMEFQFRFPFSYYIETGISTVFSFFVFPLLWKTELQLAFPFSNLTFS